MDSKTYRTQLETVYKALKDIPKTMLQVAQETGILRANICRYIRILRKLEKVAVAKKGFCPITKHWAGFYTTDKAKFPKDNQLVLSLYDGAN